MSQLKLDRGKLYCYPIVILNEVKDLSQIRLYFKPTTHNPG